MLVAENNYLYDYDYYAPSSSREKETKKTKVKKAKSSSAAKTFKMLLNISIFFAICFVIVLRYASLTEISGGIDKQKEILTNLEKTNSQLKTELSIDLNQVDEVSKNKLGMDRPYKYQVVYVDLGNNTNLNNKEVKSKNKIDIVEKIEGFVKYLY
jgi:hypothetical protein